MIKLIVLDVDGCLTNGNIIYSNDLQESKSFNVKDGLGISSWIKLGGKVAIITGRHSKIVEYRAQELGITYLYQGINNKYITLKKILQLSNLSFNKVAAIGDDLNDYKMLSSVKMSFTPRDGGQEIKEMVDHVLTCKGGEGAVREMINILLEQNNQIEDFRNLWI